MPNPSETAGLVMWALFILLVWRWRRWSVKFLETQAERGVGKTGKKWTQDAPMAECFDAMDDLDD